MTQADAGHTAPAMMAAGRGARTAVAADPAPAMAQVTDVVRTFGHGRAAVHALRGVSLTVARGRLVALSGRSGSGKTTLLNILGGLDRPDSGTVHVDGREVTAMSERERTRLRRGTVAFVFQSFGLIPILSAAENVGVPLRVTDARTELREERVRMLRASAPALVSVRRTSRLRMGDVMPSSLRLAPMGRQVYGQGAEHPRRHNWAGRGTTAWRGPSPPAAWPGARRGAPGHAHVHGLTSQAHCGGVDPVHGQQWRKPVRARRGPPL